MVKTVHELTRRIVSELLSFTVYDDDDIDYESIENQIQQFINEQGQWRLMTEEPEDGRVVLVKWPDGVVLQAKYNGDKGSLGYGFNFPVLKGRRTEWVHKIGMNGWRYYD